MAKEEKLRAALELCEELLEDLELSNRTLTQLAMRASRLARLIGNDDKQQIFLYEAAGYPMPPKDSPERRESNRLAMLAGRSYQVKEGDEEVTYYNRKSIEIIEHEAEILKLDLSSFPAGANGLAGMRRDDLKRDLSGIMSLIVQRRSFLYEFVSNSYYELKFSAVANDVFDRMRHQVDTMLGELVPVAVRKFSAIYENLASTNDEDWSNAVHSCRRILQDTADVLYPAREHMVVNNKKIMLGEENYINRLVAYAQEKSESTRYSAIVGSHLGFLGDRLDALFSAAQKGSHKTISSQEEADRCVVYTYLLVGDILRLYADDAPVQTAEALQE